MKNCAAPLVYSLGGAAAAMVGWISIEPFFQEAGCAGRVGLANAFFFPIVIGTIAGSLAATDSWYSGHRSSLIALAWSCFGMAFAAAYLLQGPSHALFAILSPWSKNPQDWPPLAGGIVSFTARGLSWAIMGSVIGLAEGVVTGNWRTSLGALMGGIFGGLVGGLTFDPVHHLLPPEAATSGWINRGVGMAIVGGTAGFVAGVMADGAITGSIRVVSDLLEGPQADIHLSPCSVGCSPCCDVYLADGTAPHAILALVQKNAFRFEIQSLAPGVQISVNGRIVRRKKLAHGDRIRVAGTDMIFSDSRFVLSLRSHTTGSTGRLSRNPTH